MSKPAKFCAKAKDAVPTIAISRNEETIFLAHAYQVNTRVVFASK